MPRDQLNVIVNGVYISQHNFYPAFPSRILKPFNQPSFQSEAKCFLREKWSSERLPSHFIPALQWGCSKHNSKQQNYNFPSDGNRSLFKNNVNNNVECTSVRSLPNSVNITLFPSGCSMFLTMSCTFLTLSLLTSVLAIPLNLQNYIFAPKSQLLRSIFLKQRISFFLKARLFTMAC